MAYFLPCVTLGQTKQLLYSKDGCFHDCCFAWCLGGLGASCYMRADIRNRFGIEGTDCDDCCTTCFCVPCALTQQYREVVETLASVGPAPITMVVGKE